MGAGQGQIPNDFPHTLPGELTAAGYRTHLVGKGHFHPQRALMGFQTTELDESGRMPTSDHRQWFASQAPDGVTPDDHGVDWNSWHARPWHTEERLHPTCWTMTRSLDFLSQQTADQPFFLNISFARPHSPYVPPKYYFDLYNGADLPTPTVGEWADMHDDPETARNPNAWRGRMTDEQIHRARAAYYGSITFIDTQIGRLMNQLQREHRDILDNTWFLFTSDHGDMQGDHNLWRKTYAYEGSTRIPFLVVPANRVGRPARPVADEVVELRDVTPTVLDIVGLPLPMPVDGQSVLPLLDAPAESWRTYIHGEHCRCYHGDQEMQFVTDGRRKYIWLPLADIEQFFDLEADPGETLNLIDDPRPPGRSEHLAWLSHRRTRRPRLRLDQRRPAVPPQRRPAHQPLQRRPLHRLTRESPLRRTHALCGLTWALQVGYRCHAHACVGMRESRPACGMPTQAWAWHRSSGMIVDATDPT